MRAELRSVLDTQLAKQTDAWEMQPDGTYVRHPARDAQKRIHVTLIDHAEKRQKQAQRLRKRRPKGFAKRSV